MSIIVKLRDTVQWADQSNTIGEAKVVGCCVYDGRTTYDLMMQSREIKLYIPESAIIAVVERAS